MKKFLSRLRYQKLTKSNPFQPIFCNLLEVSDVFFILQSFKKLNVFIYYFNSIKSISAHTYSVLTKITFLLQNPYLSFLRNEPKKDIGASVPLFISSNQSWIFRSRWSSIYSTPATFSSLSDASADPMGGCSRCRRNQQCTASKSSLPPG